MRESVCVSVCVKSLLIHSRVWIDCVQLKADKTQNINIVQNYSRQK